MPRKTLPAGFVSLAASSLVLVSTPRSAFAQAAPAPTLKLAAPPIGSVVGKPNVSQLKKQENMELRRLSANVDGRQVDADVMRLTGAEGIQSAYEQKLLPESARDALLEHAKHLDPGDPPIYIVNRQIAEEWSKAHSPLPKTEPESSPHGSGGHKHEGGLKHAEHEFSKGARHAEKEASRDAEHAGGQVSDAYKEVTGQTTKWWKHWQREATKDFEKIEECWADHKLSVRRHVSVPVPRTGFTVDLASLSLGQGTIRFDLPVTVDMDAEASVFYIPCMAVVAGSVPLPFFVRPRDVSVQNGHLAAAVDVAADVQRIAFSGSKDVITPPPIQLLPETLIMAGPVPVTLEAYLYLRGGITYNGQGSVESKFTAFMKKEGPFSFTCNGRGCEHDFSRLATTSQISQNPSAKPQIAARATLEPYFWAAVQVGAYEGFLMGRAGPEIAVSGDVWAYQGGGCGTTAGAGGPPDAVRALTADIDASVSTAWQVGTLGITDPSTGDYFSVKGVPKGRETAKKRDVVLSKHLYFGDLATSTALSPLVAANGPAAVAQPASFSVRMRPCYPYADDVEYQLEWSALNASSSGAQPIRESAWGAPQKVLVVKHTWTAPGDYVLAITPIGDKHHRSFGSAHTVRLTVHVGAQGKAGAPSPPISVSTAKQRK